MNYKPTWKDVVKFILVEPLVFVITMIKRSK